MYNLMVQTITDCVLRQGERSITDSFLISVWIKMIEVSSFEDNNKDPKPLKILLTIECNICKSGHFWFYYFFSFFSLLAIVMDSQPNKKRSHRWTEREDQCLSYLIQDCKLDNWSEVASQMEHNGFQKRPTHQYRLRWENCLDPTLIKEEWTEEENRTIINLQKRIGNKWAEIAKHLKGRYQSILHVILGVSWL